MRKERNFMLRMAAYQLGFMVAAFIGIELYLRVLR